MQETTSHDEAESNLSQDPRNKSLFIPELIKHLKFSPNVKSPTESLEMSVQENRHVDFDTASNFNDQGDVAMLDLKDIDRIMRCKHCEAQQLLGTINCSCGKLMPNLNPEIDQRIKQDTQKIINVMLTQKDMFWQTGTLRGIKGGGAAESQERHAAREHYKSSFQGDIS